MNAIPTFHKDDYRQVKQHSSHSQPLRMYSFKSENLEWLSYNSAKNVPPKLHISVTSFDYHYGSRSFLITVCW
jgi:hypothetical protein